MKHKAIMITMISVAAVCVIAAGTVLLNPSLVTNLVARTSATQPTQKPTEAPTQAPTAASVASVEIEKNKGTVEYGETLLLKAAVKPQAAQNKEVIWESSDDNIASVDSTGKVTARSAGDCTITAVSAENKTAAAKVTLKITDKRIDQINVLNEYLAQLPESQKIKGKSKEVTVSLSACKIGDFNGDGQYELLLEYRASAVTAAEIVSVKDGKASVLKTFDKLEALLSRDSTSYEESICLDQDKNFYIKTTEIKNSKTENRRSVTLYKAQGTDLSPVKEMTDVYAYKKDSTVPEKGTFTVGGKSMEEAQYLSELSALNSAYTQYSGLVNRSLTLVSGKYDKVLPVSDLDEAYLKRMEWTSSKPETAQVNKNGVVTAKAEGKCTVTATIPCFLSPVAKANVTVRDNSEALNKYLDSIKEKVVTDKNNTTLALYASKIVDIDGDSVKELLLYYTGSRSCRVDVVREKDGGYDRATAFQKTTGDSTACRLELYVDNAQSAIVLREYYRAENSNTVTFRFNKYEDGKYVKDSPDYKIAAKSAKDKDPKCYIDGERVEKTAFDSALNHYGKYSDWDINE